MVREASWELGVLTLASPLLWSCCVMTLGRTLSSLALAFSTHKVGEDLDPSSLRPSCGQPPHHPTSHCPDFSCSRNPTKRTSTRPQQGPSPL